MRERPDSGDPPLTIRTCAEKVALGCSHVQRLQVYLPEGTVRWPLGRHRVPLEHLPRRRKHVDRRTWPAEFPARGGDDVAFGVQAHPINSPVLAEIVQDCASS